MTQIRGFDPQLVQRKHVFPKTLVYGSDAVGIKLRLDRFEEILAGNGEAPIVYANASEALGYICAGDMFSDSICVIIKDMSDALKTSSESKRLYTSLLKSLATYDDSSTIVLGAPQSKPSSSLSKLISDIESFGGVCREVAAPDMSNAARWLDEYAKSTGAFFTDADKKKLLDVSNGEVSAVQEIVSAIGSEIPNLSTSEIARWLDRESDYAPSDIRKMITSKDVAAVSDFKHSMESESNGYRMFLLKMRMNVLDLLIASYGGAEPLVSYKMNQYANSNGKAAYYIARETSPAKARYLTAVYNELNRQIAELAIGKEPVFEDLVLALSSCD